MKTKAYKILISSVLLISTGTLKAQELPAPSAEPKRIEIVPPAPVIDAKDFGFDVEKLNVTLKDLQVSIENQLAKLPPLPSFDVPQLVAPLDVENRLQSDGSANERAPIEKVKKVVKSYAVDGSDRLRIENKFGKVLVKVWDKKEIKVEVDIKAFENTDGRAQDLLDGVQIRESKSSNLISLKTEISHGSNSNNIFNGDDGKQQRRGVSIDYTIFMPAQNAIEIDNKFGNVDLGDLNGAVTIKNSYGSVKAGTLSNKQNHIDVKYGSVSANKISSGKVLVAYGSLQVASGNSLDADVSYGSIKIGKIGMGGSLETRYGSLKIDELGADIRKLILSADKGSVSIGVNPAADFDFDVTVHMGGFQYPKERVNMFSQTPDNERGPTFTKSYKGRFGKTSEHAIQIKSNMGSVKIH